MAAETQSVLKAVTDLIFLITTGILMVAKRLTDDEELSTILFQSRTFVFYKG